MLDSGRFRWAPRIEGLRSRAEKTPMLIVLQLDSFCAHDLQEPTSRAEFVDADPMENPSFAVGLLDAIDGIFPVIPERTVAKGNLSS